MFPELILGSMCWQSRQSIDKDSPLNWTQTFRPLPILEMSCLFSARLVCLSSRVACAFRQLSGGERRRVALALVLGFAELISARGRLRCNLMVLDEVRPSVSLSSF